MAQAAPKQKATAPKAKAAASAAAGAPAPKLATDQEREEMKQKITRALKANNKYEELLNQAR